MTTRKPQKWSEEAWNASERIYEAIKRLPFIEELANGTLSAERFRFYISQDSQYIDDYSRALASIASRLPDMADAAQFMEFALDGVAVEKALHTRFCPDRSAGKSSVCLFYTSLLRSHDSQPVAVAAAAILPCFWIYQKVGEHLLATAKLEGNPYRDWIETYGDPAFDISTRKAIDICDRLAEATGEQTRCRMTEAYVACSRLEWMFWDSAYKMQLWPNEIA